MPAARWGTIVGLVAGGVALFWIVSSVGLESIASNVVKAGWALPGALAIHAVQLFLSAWAWRTAMGTDRLDLFGMFRVRWIRESVNSLFPVAHVGGQVVAVRLLVQAGIAPPLAVAGTILDLTLEAASQLVITLAAIGLLLQSESDRSWLIWAERGLLATTLTLAILVAAQRFGLFRLLESVLERAVARWPASSDWSMAGLHATLLQRQADRGAMLRGGLLHVVSWTLGALEVWIMLLALGHDVGLGPAFIIETLAMAARSAGFAVPGAVGVQEGGFVLACSLFGLSTETALALSIIKRLRELVVGAGGVLVWQLGRRRHPATSS